MFNRKNILLSFCLFFLLSCFPKPKNNQETLERIFTKDKFTLSINTWGCFGDRTDVFNITKEQRGYFLQSTETKKGLYLQTTTIDSFKAYLSTVMGTYESEDRWCSAGDYIKVGSKYLFVDYNIPCGDTVLSNFFDWYILLDTLSLEDSSY